MESSILSSSESVLSTQTESMEEMELSVLENSPPPRSVTSSQRLHLQKYFTRSNNLLSIISPTQRLFYRDLILIRTSLFCFPLFCSLDCRAFERNHFFVEFRLDMQPATCKEGSKRNLSCSICITKMYLISGRGMPTIRLLSSSGFRCCNCLSLPRA